MTSLSRTWIGAALAGTIVALSATAIAQNAPTSPAQQPAAQSHEHRHGATGGHHGQKAERMKAHRAEHQARLKERLQLTPAQEPAWNAFVGQLQPRDRPAGVREGWAGLTTLQRLERMEALKAERDQAMRQRHDAIRAFYAQLTPAQQKTFDEEAMGGWRRAGMTGGHGGHHGGHGMHRM